MKLIDRGPFPVDEIEVKERRRAIDPLWVKGLAEIFKSTGLQNPIQVMRVGNRFRLVAGAHRLAAFKLLGITDIPAHIYEPETDDPEAEIRLQEIIENVARRELSPLDRAAHIAELKDILQKLHGATHGGDRKSIEAKRKNQSENIAFYSLGDDVAERMGLSKRTVYADAELHNSLAPETRQRLREDETLHWLTENRAQLVQLARETPKDQFALLKLLASGKADAPPNVTAAAALHHNNVDVTTPDERNFAAFKKLWARSSRKVRRQIKAAIERDSAA